MTEKQKQECSELETMLQGTPKQNVLISFDGKPPKTLEELEKEQQRRKRNTKIEVKHGDKLSEAKRKE